MTSSAEPPFRSLIRDSATSARHASSVLVDPHQQCKYSDIPAYLQTLQNYFRSRDIHPGDCITVELNNSVRAALTAMAILDAGYSMAATPVTGQGARGSGNEIPLARMSRCVVSVNTDKASALTDLADPESYLQVRLNPDFDSSAPILATTVPRLFFRTSGSLGSPKLAVHTHAKFRGNVLNARDQMHLKPADRIALPTPIFHLYGLGVGFLAGFAGGASIDFQERGNLLRYLQREEEFNPTIAFVTPSFCEALVRGRRSARRYELMITSGDRISESTFQRSEKIHGPMINSYGCTEMGSVSTGNLTMDAEHRCRSVGRPYPGVSYRIVPSPDARADGERVGELQLKYAYGFEGYVDLGGRPLVPPTAYDDGWYRTGDLAVIRDDGTLEVLGRCDLSVNRNGVLLPFADVENRFGEIEGLEEAAVAAGPVGMRGRALIAFCVLGRGVQMTEQELRARYASRVPAYAVPDIVRIVEALPKLASGKIDRRALAGLAEHQHDLSLHNEIKFS